MTHKNEFQSSGTSPSADFTIRNEGSILLLTPHTGPARNWIDEHIGSENGYQPPLGEPFGHGAPKIHTPVRFRTRDRGF